LGPGLKAGPPGYSYKGPLLAYDWRAVRGDSGCGQCAQRTPCLTELLTSPMTRQLCLLLCSVARAKLFLQGRSQERHHRLDQALLDRGHTIGQVQSGLHVPVDFKPRELQLDLVDRVFQVPPVLNLLEKCNSLPLPCIKDLAAKDSVPRLLCRRALEAALPLLSLCNEAADVGILIN
jgi:hypothetical protein